MPNTPGGPDGQPVPMVPLVTVSESADDAKPSDGEVVPLQQQLALPSASSRFDGMRACVAGATGGTGRAIVERLVSEGVPVRALVRDGIKAVRLLPGLESGVELVQGDVFQFATLPRALEGCNVLFIATGSRPILDPLGPFNIDYQGTRNLVAAALQNKGIKRIVLVSSIGTDEPFFPLNLLWGVLFWKKRAEEEVQRCGVDYTILRPGGLLDLPKSGAARAVTMAPPGTFGLPPKQRPGSILRRQVADVCVEAAVLQEARNKVVELLTVPGEAQQPLQQLFSLY